MTVTPKKSLGQHFLVDENMLGVIDRLALLEREDVVLEVGPGLGVLTRYLADRVAVIHAVELDRSLEEPLREALGDRENVRLIFGDALALDLAALDPAPTKLVANLPYNIATPLVAESLDGIPTLQALDGDGAARGRGPLLRATADEGVRRGLGADSACDAEDRVSSGAADGVPTAAAGRLGDLGLRAAR